MKIPVTSCAKVVTELRHHYPVKHSLLLVFEQCAIEVRLVNSELLTKLCRYFKPFIGSSPKKRDILITVHEAEVEFETAYSLKSPEPGKSKIKEEYLDLADGRIVRKRLTGMHFLFGGDHNLAIGPGLANDNQIVNFINNRFIEWKLKNGCLLCHAAGVMVNGHGLALAGFSGMGKSTLALHTMSRGASFVSNDRLLVETDSTGCRMTGVAKLPRVNPGTILHNKDLNCVIPMEERHRFENLPADELWGLEHKFDADIECCFGPNKFVISAPMNALAILNWQRDCGKTTVRRVELGARPDLMPAFIKEPGLFYLPDKGEPHYFPAANYLKFLKDVMVIELGGGIDFDAGADLCMNLLQE